MHVGIPVGSNRGANTSLGKNLIREPGSASRILPVGGSNTHEDTTLTGWQVCKTLPIDTRKNAGHSLKTLCLICVKAKGGAWSEPRSDDASPSLRS